MLLKTFSERINIFYCPKKSKKKKKIFRGVCLRSDYKVVCEPILYLPLLPLDIEDWAEARGGELRHFLRAGAGRHECVALEVAAALH